MTVSIRGRRLQEPVFKKLRKIIPAYNQLAGAGSDADTVAALEIILDCLFDGQVRLKQLRNDELVALLQALPALCHLDTSTGATGPARPIDWGHIYAHLSATLGWTYDYIDNHMNLSRLTEYRHYMNQYPPTNQLVAAYLGYEYQDKQAGSSFLKAIAAQAKAGKQS